MPDRRSMRVTMAIGNRRRRRGGNVSVHVNGVRWWRGRTGSAGRHGDGRTRRGRRGMRIVQSDVTLADRVTQRHG